MVVMKAAIALSIILFANDYILERKYKKGLGACDIAGSPHLSYASRLGCNANQLTFQRGCAAATQFDKLRAVLFCFLLSADDQGM